MSLAARVARRRGPASASSSVTWEQNKPAGMTQLYTFDCQSTEPAAGSQAIAGGGGIAYYTDTVADGTAPAGTGPNVWQHLLPAGTTNGGNSNIYLVPGVGVGYPPYPNLGPAGAFYAREIYMCLWIKFSAGYRTHAVSEKLFYFTMMGPSGVQTSAPIFIVPMADGNRDGPNIRFFYFPSYQGDLVTNGGEPIYATGTNPLIKNQWQMLEVCQRINTSGGTFDGHTKVWVDGQPHIIDTATRTSDRAEQQTFQSAPVEYLRGGGYDIVYPLVTDASRRFAKITVYGKTT